MSTVVVTKWKIVVPGTLNRPMTVEFLTYEDAVIYCEQEGKPLTSIQEFQEEVIQNDEILL